MCADLLLGFFLNLLLVIAGHLECAHGVKKKKRKVPEQVKEGEGSLCFSFHSLHREIMGLSQADSVTSFCEFHTKGRIMDGGPDRVDGDSGMFS